MTASPARAAWSRVRRAVLVLVSAAGLNAQTPTTKWILPGTGDFNTAANWSIGLPNSTTDAAITNGTLATPTIVNLSGTGSARNLQLGADDTLNVGLGSALSISGSQLANNGTLNLTAGSGNNTYLSLGRNTTLSGGGTITLDSGDNNGRAILQQQVDGLNLTNADNLIHGYGIIGLAVTNSAAGTIRADVPGQVLQFNGAGALTNNGTLEIASGATLQVTGNLPNHGTVSLAADVTGAGTLTLTGNYSQDAGGALLDVVGSPYSGQFNVTGNLTLNGSLTVGLVSGFTPAVGSTFALINYTGNQAGNFTNVFDSGSTLWTVLYNPGQIALQFNGFQPVPEPPVWLYLLIALPLVLGLPVVRRKLRPAQGGGVLVRTPQSLLQATQDR